MKSKYCGRTNVIHILNRNRSSHHSCLSALALHVVLIRWAFLSLHFKSKFLVAVGNVGVTTLNRLTLGLGITPSGSFVWQILVFECHQHFTQEVFGFLFILFCCYFIWLLWFEPEFSNLVNSLLNWIMVRLITSHSLKDFKGTTSLLCSTCVNSVTEIPSAIPLLWCFLNIFHV